MKATLPWLAAVLVAALTVSAAYAQSFDPRCPPSPNPPQAPDCCGPYYYTRNFYGAWYGPNYIINPGFLPYNGEVFAPCGGGNGLLGSPAFSTWPYARSPRDYFMVDVK
ncbi:MAG TPA: hypothetical protein VMS17_16875 [Gemmataceae bacterium]|nr:hypothetical protein [Gemmataceae bacterium]